MRKRSFTKSIVSVSVTTALFLLSFIPFLIMGPSYNPFVDAYDSIGEHEEGKIEIGRVAASSFSFTPPFLPGIPLPPNYGEVAKVSPRQEKRIASYLGTNSLAYYEAIYGYNMYDHLPEEEEVKENSSFVLMAYYFNEPEDLLVPLSPDSRQGELPFALPQGGSEIAISSDLFSLFLKYGYKESYYAADKTEIQTASDIIGKNYFGFRVTSIVDSSSFPVPFAGICRMEAKERVMNRGAELRNNQDEVINQGSDKFVTNTVNAFTRFQFRRGNRAEELALVKETTEDEHAIFTASSGWCVRKTSSLYLGGYDWIKARALYCVSTNCLLFSFLVIPFEVLFTINLVLTLSKTKRKEKADSCVNETLQ